MSPPNQEPQRDRQTWFSLISLVQDCPACIGRIKIMGATRQILTCIALHADGDTCETFVEKDTMMDECAITHNTLDDSGRSEGGRAPLVSNSIQRCPQIEHFDPEPLAADCVSRAGANQTKVRKGA